MRVLTLWSLSASWRVMYNEVLTLWSLRATWRMMYNEGAYHVVFEGLLEGDVQ